MHSGSELWHLHRSSSRRDAEEGWVWADGEHRLVSGGGWRKRSLTSAIGSGGKSIKVPPQERMNRLWGLGLNEETQRRVQEARGWEVRKEWTHCAGSPRGGSPLGKIPLPLGTKGTRTINWEVITSQTAAEAMGMGGEQLTRKPPVHRNPVGGVGEIMLHPQTPIVI